MSLCLDTCDQSRDMLVACMRDCQQEATKKRPCIFFFTCDVTAAMLAYRTIAKKVFWGFYCYAKLERHFAIVLYTNMAVLSRQWKPGIRQGVSGYYWIACFSAMSFLLVIPRAICGAWKLLTRHNGLEFLKTTPITTKRVKTLSLSPSVVRECNHNGWNK